MGLTNLSVALLLVSLAGWWLIERLRRSGAHSRSDSVQGALSMNVVRASLVIAALLAHLNFFDWTPSNLLVARIPATHYHETFHYYLGTRYFAELGYTGLYHAAVLADFENDPAAYEPNDLMRDLFTNQLVPRSTALQSSKEIRAAFSNQRWEAFKRDVALHKATRFAKQWTRTTMDHGYNGTPMVTALLALVASQPWIPTAQFLSYVGLLDLALIVLFCAFVGMREGAALGLSFLFFIFANPLNDFSFVGASYLRYGYFLALAGSLLALRRNWLATSGLLLALAGWMRIFPLAIYGYLLIRDVAHSDWRERLLAGRRLHVSFAVATIAILAGTSLLSTPDGRNPWLSFAANIRAHSDMTAINQVSLAVPLTYSPARERLHTLPGGEGDAPSASSSDWEMETERIQRERAWLVRAIAAVLLVFSLATLRHAGRTAVLIPSLLAIFCVLPMTHYYWAVLSLLPLALPDDPRIRNALLVLFAALGLTAARDLLSGHLDLRFALMSVQLLIFLLYCCFTVWRSARATSS